MRCRSGPPSRQWLPGWAVVVNPVHQTCPAARVVDDDDNAIIAEATRASDRPRRGCDDARGGAGAKVRPRDRTPESETSSKPVTSLPATGVRYTRSVVPGAWCCGATGGGLTGERDQSGRGLALVVAAMPSTIARAFAECQRAV